MDISSSRPFSKMASFQTFDFFTLYTTIPDGKLKIHLKEIIHNTFYRERYKFIVLGHEFTYSVKHETKCKKATQKMNSSVCWISLSKTHLSSSVGNFFNKSSESLWEQNVPLFLPIFFYTPIVFTKHYQNKIHKPKPLITLSGILMMFCQLIIQTLETGFLR